MKILSNKQWKKIVESQKELTDDMKKCKDFINEIVDHYNATIEAINKIAKLNDSSIKDIRKLETQVEKLQIKLDKLNEIKVDVVCDSKELTKQTKKASEKVEKNTVEEVKKALNKGITKENKVKPEPKKRGRKPKNTESVEAKNENKKSKKN